MKTVCFVLDTCDEVTKNDEPNMNDSYDRFVMLVCVWCSSVIVGLFVFADIWLDMLIQSMAYLSYT